MKIVHKHRLFIISSLILMKLLKKIQLSASKPFNSFISCCFIACKIERIPLQLIDFATSFNLNIFELGKELLRIYKNSNFRFIELSNNIIDPSLFINKFINQLNLGVQATHIANLALKIISKTKFILSGKSVRAIGLYAAAICLALNSIRVYKNSSQINKNLKKLAHITSLTIGTLKKRLKELIHYFQSMETIKEILYNKNQGLKNSSKKVNLTQKCKIMQLSQNKPQINHIITLITQGGSRTHDHKV
mmetsp:Transcript_14281/g.19868  ORF Transcript_14281/g.19868 Transcript_14281/m.19868 type:complete len:248 (+) Transcript_14281:71-814(+)